MILSKALPPNIEPNDRPTFVIMLIAIKEYCLLSIKSDVSKAKEDIVVNPPQNPIATSNIYLSSRFHCCERTENPPRIKLPTIFTINMFTGNAPRNNGDFVIPYRRKVPANPPIAKNTTSIPFMSNHFPC